MKDTQLLKIFGLPTTTSRDWKKKELSDYRKKIYLFLKTLKAEEAEKMMNEIVDKDEEGQNTPT